MIRSCPDLPYTWDFLYLLRRINKHTLSFFEKLTYLIDISLACEKKSTSISKFHLYYFFPAAYGSKGLEYEITYRACNPSSPSADIACTAASNLYFVDFA
jgi:hypothetical protein